MGKNGTIVCVCMYVCRYECMCVYNCEDTFVRLNYFFPRCRKIGIIFARLWLLQNTHIYYTYIYVCVYVYYLRLYYTITIMINSPFSREKEKERRTHWAPIYIYIGPFSHFTHFLVSFVFLFLLFFTFTYIILEMYFLLALDFLFLYFCTKTQHWWRRRFYLHIYTYIWIL